MSFLAKCRAEKKADKVNTDGTVQDLQVTNVFLSMCGQDAVIKLRSLISPKNLIDTPYKDIKLTIQNYVSPKGRFVTAERAKILSIIQGVGESHDDFVARLREEVRYCYFEKLKTAGNPAEELVIRKFISGLREPEAKLRLLHGMKAKPARSVTEMTEILQFRSKATAFASSPSVKKLFTVKQEVGFNFKKTFRKPNEKFTANKRINMCNRRGGKPYSSKPCPALVKNATPVKRWDTSQKSVEANPNQIQESTINRIIFAKK